LNWLVVSRDNLFQQRDFNFVGDDIAFEKFNILFPCK